MMGDLTVKTVGRRTFLLATGVAWVFVDYARFAKSTIQRGGRFRSENV